MKAISKISLTALICASSLLAAAPAQAQLKVSQYYCNGGYGDKSDRGLWDWTFTADSEADARNQAIRMYMKGLGEGAFVDVFKCIKL